MIYGPRNTSPLGPAQAVVGVRKSKKRKENVWVEALKTNAIRTALKLLKKQKNSTPESPKYSRFRIGDVVTMALTLCEGPSRCITRHRRPQLAAGGSLIGVSAAHHHLGIPARRGGRASFQRSALEYGRVSSWSCCRVAMQPCWRR